MSDSPSGFSWIEGWEDAAAEPAGRDRREAERLLAYWDRKLRQLGDDATVAALDLDRMSSSDWANRFLISVDPIIERSVLILYGPKFAKLLSLPEQARIDVPMMRQLPRRYTDVFLRGCADAQKDMRHVRLEGEVTRYDDRIEQYRVIFMPIRIKPNALTCFAFGAFSNRILDPA